MVTSEICLVNRQSTSPCLQDRKSVRIICEKLICFPNVHQLEGCSRNFRRKLFQTASSNYCQHPVISCNNFSPYFRHSILFRNFGNSIRHRGQLRSLKFPEVNFWISVPYTIYPSNSVSVPSITIRQCRRKSILNYSRLAF